MPRLKAAPGRVVLKFPSAPPKIGSIHIPETSQMRPEFPEIDDIGDPVTDEDKIYYRWLAEAKRGGIRPAVSYMTGVSYWKENYDPSEYGWLKDYRVYTLREVASVVISE